MPMIEFSETDIARNRIVEPAFYRVRINKVTEKLAKSGNTTNYWIEGEILCNADTGDEKFKGTPTPFLFMFNSGAIGKAVPFVEALQGEAVNLKAGEKKRFELKNAEGKIIDMFIGNGLYEGQIQNTITGQFRTAKVAA